MRVPLIMLHVIYGTVELIFGDFDCYLNEPVGIFVVDFDIQRLSPLPPSSENRYLKDWILEKMLPLILK